MALPHSAIDLTALCDSCIFPDHTHLLLKKIKLIPKWAASGETLSSGFPNKYDSRQSI